MPYLIISEKCLIEGEVHMEALISVIMSTYNESVSELRNCVEMSIHTIWELKKYVLR